MRRISARPRSSPLSNDAIQDWLPMTIRFLPND
jgi:hypothetical protein